MSRRGASITPGSTLMGRSSSRDQARLACLLAKSRRFRPADDDRLGSAGGFLGREHISGPCPSALCKAASAITAMPARPIFSSRSAVANEVAAGRTAAFSAEASWLVCAEICIPGGASLSLSLACRGRADYPRSRRSGAFRRSPPATPLPAAFETRFVSGADRLPPAGSGGRARRIEGSDRDIFSERRIADRPCRRAARRAASNDGLEIVLKKANTRAAAPATLDGVLALRGADGAERAFEISASPAAALPARIGLAWWQALLLAFLGGVVLNAMPCVFPILSLKLLSLARQAHGHRIGAAGSRARLYGRSAGELCRAWRHAAGAARRRPSDRLGLSAADAALCRGDRLSPFRDGAEPLGCCDFGAGFAGTGGRLAGAFGPDGDILHRSVGDDRRDPLHGALYGCCPRFCGGRARRRWRSGSFWHSVSALQRPI